MQAKQWFMVLGIYISMLNISETLGIINGQVDDFQAGTVMGWSKGFLSPNPPIVNSDGGPSGLGDHSLQNHSSGGVGSGSRMAMFNNNQWTGDYLTAGVEKIDLMMKASSIEAALSMRIAVKSGITWYASTNAFALPNDDQWYTVSFGLSAADMSLVPLTGTAALCEVLHNVSELRILSVAAVPNFRGDAVVATLNVDNVTAAGSGQALLADISGPFGLRDCRVDYFDFALLASEWQTLYTLADLQQMMDEWLACNDPSGCP